MSFDYGARLVLERVDQTIASAYSTSGHTGGARADLQPLAKRSSGRFTVDTCAALIRLHELTMAQGGDFRITDGLRTVDVQAQARAKYERWLSAGKPTTAADGFDSSKHKAAFVAKPGFSFHNAGRAVDIDLRSLKFPEIAEHSQLDFLWSLAVPLGFRPAIRAPDERASEAWHFDVMGPWAPVHDRLGYEQAAMCAVLDVGGHAAFDHPVEREIQAQLHRAGFDIGMVDGVIGARTRTGFMQATTMTWPIDFVQALQSVRSLQDSATAVKITG